MRVESADGQIVLQRGTLDGKPVNIIATTIGGSAELEKISKRKRPLLTSGK